MQKVAQILRSCECLQKSNTCRCVDHACVWP